jgi:tripartite-type tricarboxylate transporter receptor subunit TctC
VPNGPTSAEAGIKGYVANAWYGLLAPAGTPATALQSLKKLAQQLADQANTSSKLQSLGMKPQHSCRDAKAYIKLANELNLKAE